MSAEWEGRFWVKVDASGDCWEWAASRSAGYGRFCHRGNITGSTQLAHRIAYEFSISEMLPAVGQGIVAVECAAQDWQTRRILSAIDDAAAHSSADAEREVLWVLNGHCNSPIAGFSSIDGTQMSLTASVLDEAGGLFIEASRSGPADRPRELGRAVGLELLAKGAAAIIERSRPV